MQGLQCMILKWQILYVQELGTCLCVRSRKR